MKRTKEISIVVLFVTMCILFVFSSVSFATVNGDELVDSMYTEDIDGWTNWLEVASDSWYDSGDGTIKEFTINTAEELAGLTKLVYEGNSFSGEKIILGKDISLEGKKWTPIGYGDGGDYFLGEFDGNGKTISELTIVGEGESQRLGFF